MFRTSLMLLMFIIRNMHYGMKDWDLLITANVAAKSILLAEQHCVSLWDV